MKLSKNLLIKIISGIMNLAEKNTEHLKSAVGKINVMKSEKIADQKLIIEVQRGHINSVQETVKLKRKVGRMLKNHCLASQRKTVNSNKQL